MKNGILSIGKVFGTIRKGLEYLQKINKMLQSIMIVQKHATALIDDLETVWSNQPVKQPEQ